MKPIPQSSTLSRLAREAQIEKMEASWMVEGKGTKRHKQIVRDEQPNTGRVHQMEPDGPLHHPVGATNQPRKEANREGIGDLWFERCRIIGSLEDEEEGAVSKMRIYNDP